MINVLIVGGGAAGVILANSLAGLDYNITLIDKSEYHFYQPWYLYIAFKGSKRKIWKEIKTLLKPGINFIKDEVREINLNDRYVSTNSGKKYNYDYIAVCNGIYPDTSDIEGLDVISKSFGNYHNNLNDAMKIYQNLEKFKGGTIVLGQASPFCKCPPSMLEGMFLLEEYINKKGLKNKTRLIFFSPFATPYPAENMNEIIKPFIEERNIEVYTYFDLEGIDIENKKIKSIEGESIKYDFPIIAPPCRGPKNIVYEPENVLGEERYIKADKYTMKIKGFDDAFAVGDVNTVPTSKTGVAAHLEAKVVANIIKGIDSKYDGRINCPFDVGYGKGTFVIADYQNPVIPYPPDSIKYMMKMMMARIYWMTLQSQLDNIFDLYFDITKPEKLAELYKIEKI
ncbi:MAG: FAD/NAD(P)-binding oxidoreductase [Thermoplasmata archaeon]